MVDFQRWIVSTFAGATAVRDLMHTQWAWPIAESIHFIGLSLLVGSIVLFDVRLLGLGRSIPLRPLHRLVPWALLGFALNLVTGTLFLLAEPDQYVYNSAFHWKVAFLAIAGVNAGLFYLLFYKHAMQASDMGDPHKLPRGAKAIAAISIMMWLSVIVAGRLLTFYRPVPCEPGEAGVLARCIPGYYE